MLLQLQLLLSNTVPCGLGKETNNNKLIPVTREEVGLFEI